MGRRERARPPRPSRAWSNERSHEHRADHRLAAGLVGACYIFLILVPAWRCYGRLWEKVAAELPHPLHPRDAAGTGAAIGLAIVWSYDQYA